MTADAVNALFEGFGAALLALNVRELWRTRRLVGVRVVPTAWFSLWGAWNLYYYHAIGQRLSWLAGLAVFCANSTWVLLALFRSERE